MRAMKDSGIEWVGQIPEGWRVERGKNIIIKLERPIKEDDGVVTCFRDGEVTLRSNRREDGFTVSLQETGYQGIEEGDLVVHGMDGFAGSIGISDSRGKATPVLNVLDSEEDKRYLMYYMRSAAFCGLFLSLATGIRVRTCDTNWNKLKNVLFLVPPRSEQEKISAFIDYQCSEIDSSIEKTKASIEEYKKLRQALIVNAVTRGIHKGRLLIDSGNGWIGAIPSGWEVKKTRYICRSLSKGSGITKEDVSPDGNIQCVRYGEIYSKYDRDFSSTVSRTNEEEITSPKFIHKGEILFACTGELVEEIGKNVVYMGELPCLAGGDIIVMQHSQNPRFLNYALNSSYSQAQKSAGKIKLKVVHISAGEIGNIYIALPPLVEQDEIANYLDEKCAEIEALISKKEQFLVELDNYKKSMIYEYVTGKKEVPHS